MSKSAPLNRNSNSKLAMIKARKNLYKLNSKLIVNQNPEATEPIKKEIVSKT